MSRWNIDKPLSQQIWQQEQARKSLAIRNTSTSTSQRSVTEYNTNNIETEQQRIAAANNHRDTERAKKQAKQDKLRKQLQDNYAQQRANVIKRQEDEKQREKERKDILNRVGYSLTHLYLYEPFIRRKEQIPEMLLVKHNLNQEVNQFLPPEIKPALLHHQYTSLLWLIRLHPKFQVYRKFIFKHTPITLIIKILEYCVDYETNLTVVKSNSELNNSIERITGQRVFDIPFGIHQVYNFCGYYHSPTNSTNGDVDTCGCEARSCERLLAHVIHVPHDNTLVFMIISRKSNEQKQDAFSYPILYDIICDYGYVTLPYKWDYLRRTIWVGSDLLKRHVIERPSTLVPILIRCHKCDRLLPEYMFRERYNCNTCTRTITRFARPNFFEGVHTPF